MTVLPPRVRPGDTIGICAPAGPVSAERLGVGVKALERRYQVRVTPGVMDNTGYLAGSDERRADELNQLLADPDVRAIVPARGGYGIMRILPRLDADALRRDPKLIVGYSDATALLSWAMVRAGVRGVHGPMVAHFGELSAEDQQWMIALMESDQPAGPLPCAGQSFGDDKTGPVSGPLMGGNLCLLSHLVGTPFEIDLAGAVLLLEDVGEKPYAIDRYLTHLELAGALAGVAGACVGELLRCQDSVRPSPGANEVVLERLEHAGIPGVAGLAIGHGSRNLAVPYGGRCELELSTGVVRLVEAAVAG